MKILFLNEYAPPHQVSGAEYSMMALVKGLQESGIDVKILSPDLGSKKQNLKFPFIKKIKPGAILSPLWFNNPLFWFYSAYWIYKEIKKNSIDILHVHGKYILPGAVIAGWLTKKPVIVTIRDFNYLCPLALCFTNQQGQCSFSYFLKNEIKEYHQRYSKANCLTLITSKLWQYVLKWWLKQSKSIIAISPELKQIYQKSGVKNITSIFNLPPSKFLSTRPEYRIKNKKIVISIGKLSYGKGTDTLLQAMRILQEKKSNLTLLLAGKINISLKEKFPVNVKYLGQLTQKQVHSLYNSADLFIIASRWPEPFGRVTLEALMAGLPIIASNRGASREFIKNNGYLFNPDNPEELANLILKIFKIKNIGKLKENSLNLFKTRFNRQKLLQQHLNLYYQLTHN